MRIYASYEKWKDKEVRLLRDIKTKGGTEFKKGEILRICGVTKPGYIDLIDDSKNGRMILGIHLRFFEVVGDVQDKVTTLLSTTGQSYTVTQIAKAIEAPYGSVYYVLTKLVEAKKLVRIDNPRRRYQYRWVLPRTSHVFHHDDPRTIWERLENT